MLFKARSKESRRYRFSRWRSGTCHPQPVMIENLKRNRSYEFINGTTGRGKDNPVQHGKVECGTQRMTQIRYDLVENCGGKHATDVYHWNADPRTTLLTVLPRMSAPLPNPSRSDIWDKVVNPERFAFFETVAEGPKGLYSAAQSVIGKARFLNAAIRKLPSLPTSRRAARKALRKGGSDLLSGYLEVEFGWKQLYEDADNLGKSLAGFRRQLAKLKKEENSVIRKSFVRQGSENIVFTVGASTYNLQVDWTSRVTYRLKYNFTNGNGYLNHIPGLEKAAFRVAKSMDYFGVSLSAKRVWAITPASWLIDQIVPVSDFLSDMGNSDALLGSHQRVQWLGGTWSRRYRFSGTVRVPSPYPYTGSEDRIFPFKGSYYERGLQNPPPVFSIRAKDGLEVSKTGQAYVGLKFLNSRDGRKLVEGKKVIPPKKR